MVETEYIENTVETIDSEEIETFFEAPTEFTSESFVDIKQEVSDIRDYAQITAGITLAIFIVIMIRLVSAFINTFFKGV